MAAIERGIALTFGLWGGAASGNTAFWWGLVPTGLGMALVLAAMLESRELPRPDEPPHSNIPSRE